ncbi:PhzF family phenazine biosynthesis protein [Pseudonocardia sp. TRM90224]|uniref:PhzF family phenazine biosynthesis protein n=1 Tax=Pseudonocardia sp. TRM90224 TaxID=2812678 RepID=UPI001E28DA7A|nr:PhzF family phenazine biosynthesis protein [Pseudonocardia sp. TRM90224]
MPTDIAFHMIDVFAAEPLTGNPLPVVPDADALGDDRMRAIASEFNQAETTFLVAPTLPGADRRLRSFTPAGHEVGGAGHNAMGAWLWLALAGRLDLHGPSTSFVQEIAGRALPLTVLNEPGEPITVVMEQEPPRFLGVPHDRDELAASLGLAADDVRGDLPAQVVDTGAGHLMVPLLDRAAVDRARPDTARLATALRAVGGEGAYVYSLDAPGGAVAYTRFFNPTMGIVEDPATGTAAGPLVALLVRAGLAPSGTSIIEQGHHMGRPSRLSVTIEGEHVRLAGSGVVSMSGTLHL